MSIFINVYLKNIFNKGFSIERTDTKSESILLNKFNFSEILSIMLPEISETAVNLILKEVINRGSKTIKCNLHILNELNIWSNLEPGNNTGIGNNPNIGVDKFKLQAKAFFRGINGEFFLLTVDSDGSLKYIKDDPNKYINVFIFEQPIYPLPVQNGL